MVGASGGGELRGSGLHFAYGAVGAYGAEGPEVLRGVDVLVAPGDLLFVLGPNGAGKSTLLQILCGCLPPSAGEVTHGREGLDGLGPLETARRVAVVPQGLDGVGDVRVEDFVLGGRYAHMGRLRGPGPEDFEAVAGALARTATEGFRGRTMSELSGGQRQRVLLARALAQGARTLLLDEPTASLDPHFQAEVLGLVAGLAEEGYGILLVTHDLAWAGRFASRVLLLQAGRVVANGTPREVLRRECLEPVYGPHLWFGEGPGGSGPLVVPWPMDSGDRPSS